MNGLNFPPSRVVLSCSFAVIFVFFSIFNDFLCILNYLIFVPNNNFNSNEWIHLNWIAWYIPYFTLRIPINLKTYRKWEHHSPTGSFRWKQLGLLYGLSQIFCDIFKSDRYLYSQCRPGENQPFRIETSRASLEINIAGFGTYIWIARLYPPSIPSSFPSSSAHI